MLNLISENSFKKDLKSQIKSGLQKEPLETVVQTLLEKKPLEKQYKDHKLIGNYKNCRECHVKADLLLIYRVIGENLHLIRLGSHSELFG